MGFREPALNFWNGESRMKKSIKVVVAVRALAEPIARSLGYELWDVKYVKEGANYYLRIEIDSPNGITLDDCEKMHRAIDPVLDEADPIEGPYHLEVSSCGVERELTTNAHLEACVGWRVEVRLYTAWNGAKVWTGVLKGMDHNCSPIVACDPDGTERAFPNEYIASVRTVYDFGADGE